MIASTRPFRPAFRDQTLRNCFAQQAIWQLSRANAGALRFPLVRILLAFCARLSPSLSSLASLSSSLVARSFQALRLAASSLLPDSTGSLSPRPQSLVFSPSVPSSLKMPSIKSCLASLALVALAFAPVNASKSTSAGACPLSRAKSQPSSTETRRSTRLPSRRVAFLSALLTRSSSPLYRRRRPRPAR